MPEKKVKIKIIIVSTPGSLQISLRALLDVEEALHILGCVGGALSAYDLIHEKQPDVVLVDSNLPQDEMSALINKIVAETPEIHTVVLAETRHYKHQAQKAGANIVLPQGRGLEETIEAIKTSISPN